MIHILCTTNRQGSNTFLLCKHLQASIEQTGKEAKIFTLQDLPSDALQSILYTSSNKPEQFDSFLQDFLKAKRFIFVVPEYNGSFPSSLKVLIDALPYPSPLKGSEIALIGLSAGSQGSALALSHLTDILHYLKINVFPLKIRFPYFSTVFSREQISFIDTKSKDLLQEFMEEYLERN